MAFFCVGCLIAGILAKKSKSENLCDRSSHFVSCRFYGCSMTGTSISMLYLGFGVLCGLGAGFATMRYEYHVCMFPDKQGLISGILLMGFGLSAFIVGKIFAAVTPSSGGMNGNLPSVYLQSLSL